jgi:hypothetical protein
MTTQTSPKNLMRTAFTITMRAQRFFMAKTVTKKLRFGNI